VGRFETPRSGSHLAEEEAELAPPERHRSLFRLLYSPARFALLATHHMLAYAAMMQGQSKKAALEVGK
jgi:hypothetical protein